MCLRSLVTAGALLTAIMSAAHAQQPTFPFLQDGGARTAFVSGTYRTCLEKQRAAGENATFSPPELGAFCLCYGRGLADAINGADYEALLTGQVSDSFAQKARVASNICLARISPSQQASEKQTLIVAVENRCRREYHLEDTDFAASQVRERFCGCYAEAVTRSGKEAISPKDAVDY